MWPITANISDIHKTIATMPHYTYNLVKWTIRKRTKNRNSKNEQNGHKVNIGKCLVFKFT